MIPLRVENARIADAILTLQWGQTTRAMFGHSTSINNLARFLREIAPLAWPKPIYQFERRLWAEK